MALKRDLETFNSTSKPLFLSIAQYVLRRQKTKHIRKMRRNAGLPFRPRDGRYSTLPASKTKGENKTEDGAGCLVTPKYLESFAQSINIF
jgi:hypothetical protein